jgi:hypothetical protein
MSRKATKKKPLWAKKIYKEEGAPWWYFTGTESDRAAEPKNEQKLQQESLNQEPHRLDHKGENKGYKRDAKINFPLKFKQDYNSKT